jgi:hypothetical protein
MLCASSLWQRFEPNASSVSETHLRVQRLRTAKYECLHQVCSRASSHRLGAAVAGRLLLVWDQGRTVDFSAGGVEFAFDVVSSDKAEQILATIIIVALASRLYSSANRDRTNSRSLTRGIFRSERLKRPWSRTSIGSRTMSKTG